MKRNKRLRVAFVGGPMYDYPYSKIPEFERETGYQVELGAKLIHPQLNEHIADLYSKGKGAYDLITTHSKYAPSQKEWLSSLDEDIGKEELAGYIPATIELMRINGNLMQLPRNIDVKLVYYRKDLFEDPKEKKGFKKRFGYELEPPKIWPHLRDIARFFTRPPDLYGFVFPGRYSGLFGHFFELLAMAGGTLLDKNLKPKFTSQSGEWALGFLRGLYFVDKSCPKEVPDWHYDEVAQFFREGKAAMTTDWPGSFADYKNPTISKVKDRFAVCIYPSGPSGKRRVYAGGFSYAIPRSCQDRSGALSLMRFLLSDRMQYEEAKRGAIPVKKAVRERIKKEAQTGSMEEKRLLMLEQTVNESLLIPPKFAKYPLVEDVLWKFLQDGFTGKSDVKKVLEKAADKIGRILK
ncbi:MAG: extracellular solute-binding protein [Candidatus Omnitrophota bacterium]